MFLVGILSWWYGEGWKSRMTLMQDRLASTADFFSIGLMFKTLFAPFRQISAGSVDGGMANQFRALVDKLVSRTIGAIARLCVIIAATIILAFQSVFILMVMLIWPIIPLMPIIGLMMGIFGWVPIWQM